ncbi:MAG: substrate-binding domain-containing protein [Spirochaetota bacterium]
MYHKKASTEKGPSLLTTVKSGRIAAQLKTDIASGVYGESIPGSRMLAGKYRANFKTINKAISRLVADGTLYHVRGKGAFIRRPPRGAGGIIGMFMRVSGHLYLDMASALIGKVQEAGFLPVVNEITPDGFRINFLSYISRLVEHDPYAFVIEGVGGNINFTHLKNMRHKLQNLIFGHICEHGYDFDATYILADYQAGGYCAAKHLIELGHSRIAFVGSETRFTPAQYRLTSQYHALRGFKQALREHDLSEQHILLESLVSPEHIASQWRGLLTIKDRPTALVVFADHRIVRAMPVIRSLKLSVPRDLALVGFFDTPWCSILDVPLTSISIDEKRIGTMIAERIIKGDFTKERIMVPPRLVVRSSCGSLKGISTPHEVHNEKLSY